MSAQKFEQLVSHLAAFIFPLLFVAAESSLAALRRGVSYASCAELLHEGDFCPVLRLNETDFRLPSHARSVGAAVLLPRVRLLTLRSPGLELGASVA